MAIEWMDNFAAYGFDGQQLMLDGLYAEVSNIDTALVNDPDPNGTGIVLRVGANSAAGVRRALGGPRSQVGFAARVYLNALPSLTDTILVEFADVDNFRVGVLQVDTTGSLSFFFTSTPNETKPQNSVRSNGPVLVAGSSQHVEVMTTFGATGSVTVRVEGVQVMTFSSLLLAASCSQIRIGRGNFLSGTNIFYKDVVCYNNLGTFNRTFLGTVSVVSVVPSSDVALNWGLSQGSTGFQILDNAPPVDSAFISAIDAPIPAAYVAELTNLPPDVTSVKAVQTVVRARKIDGGDGNMQVGLTSGASTGNGDNRPISSAFTYWFDVFETDPATSAPWSPIAVDSARIRINRTA